MDCRLIFDEPARGDWNMAVDEALLLSVGGAGQGGACLRFYQWNEPTVSLGYFQRHADRQSHRPSLQCPIVRRSTGGGAIVHDHELTYCFAIATSTHIGSELEAYYDAFHGTLIDELATWNVHARLCVASEHSALGTDSFLCFERRTDGDVLLSDCKIAGSAQRRHRGALLQHGSVLLKRSNAAPELAGIAELGPVSIDLQILAKQWVKRIADRLKINLIEGVLSNGEQNLAEQIRQDKFTSRRWTCRR
jgi:lipoate-protein ligase A